MVEACTQTLAGPVIEQYAGLTVMVNVLDGPGQLVGGNPGILDVCMGVTVIVAVTGVVPVLIPTKDAMFPVPLPARPMLVLLFVQVNEVAESPVNMIGAVL